MADISESKTISVAIARDSREVYAFMEHPLSFAQWASGLGKPLRGEGTRWTFESADGKSVDVRFTPRNPYGVLDHYVSTGQGNEIYIPMRVIPNREGSEVLFTLFRTAGMSDAQFAADAQWVERDLAELKRFLEQQ
ncbi:SRPBCC family protein [Paraburkholderia terrae]|uniref:Polyketide cyclase n=1 Tax=Paraburkholderia terrae TaxID=311230 RepID=A0ABN6JI93_9BURK|nr:SRPBCC family protein [Paraburkholderia terrae]BCZ79587.1 polyketide cyclase [Paraburkholderia terrae]BDC41942.1 polyketide cyclase [Paraburkholderia terrae]